MKKMIKVNKENLEEFINKKDIAFLVIGAEWSGPFRQMIKAIDLEESNYKDIVIFGVSNSDFDNYLYEKYGILCNPVIVIYHKGELLSTCAGAVELKNTINAILNGHWGKKSFLDKHGNFLFYAALLLILITMIRFK